MTDIPAVAHEATGRPAGRRRITTNFLVMSATGALGLVDDAAVLRHRLSNG